MGRRDTEFPPFWVVRPARQSRQKKTVTPIPAGTVVTAVSTAWLPSGEPARLTVRGHPARRCALPGPPAPPAHRLFAKCRRHGLIPYKFPTARTAFHRRPPAIGNVMPRGGAAAQGVNGSATKPATRYWAGGLKPLICASRSGVRIRVCHCPFTNQVGYDLTFSATHIPSCGAPRPFG